MAQQVSCTTARSCNTCSAQCPVDDYRDGTVRAEGMKGRAATDKNSVGFCPRAAMFEIFRQRAPYLVSQRQASMTASLSMDVNPRVLPVDVAQSELNDVAGPKPKPCKKKQNRTITCADRRRQIARSDQPFHVVLAQIPWEGGQTPVRQNRDCGIQAGSAFAFRDQKPKEHPKSGRALLSRGPAALLTGFHNKLPQVPCTKLFGLLSEPTEQLANMDAVIVKRRLADASQLAHPIAEVSEQWRVLDDARDSGATDDARISKVRKE
jgi:hypothetical protein